MLDSQLNKIHSRKIPYSCGFKIDKLANFYKTGKISIFIAAYSLTSSLLLPLAVFEHLPFGKCVKCSTSVPLPRAAKYFIAKAQ